MTTTQPKGPLAWLLNRLRALKLWVLIKAGMIEEKKHASELTFWRGWVEEHGTAPETEYYRKFMMNMGGVADQSFFDNKICVDLGCGPKGSLTWLTNARSAIGLDPLAEDYTEFGIAAHPMLYLSSKAETMPFPSHYVDVVFSMNSLDHVDDLPRTCAEIRRVLKPGGHFIASLNLDEPPTATEPWVLTEALLETLLFHGWVREVYEIRPKVNDEAHFGPYKYFYQECPKELLNRSGPKALWCRFRVPGKSTGA